MRKITLLGLVLGMIISSFGQEARLDSTFEWGFNGLDSSFRYTYRYTYDSSGNLLNFNIGNYGRAEFTYDSNGNELTMFYFQYDIALVNWKKTYDSNGNMLSFRIQHWYTDAQVWVNEEKHEYTYYSNGNIESHIKFYSWDEGAWQYSTQTGYKYTYNSDGNISNRRIFHWDSTNQVTTGNGYAENEYTYDTIGNLLSDAYLYDSGRDGYKKEYTYNTNRDTLSYTYYDWTGSDWSVSHKYEYTYDSDGNMLSETEYSWFSQAQVWLKEYVKRNFYSIPTTPSDKIVNDTTIYEVITNSFEEINKIVYSNGSETFSGVLSDGGDSIVNYFNAFVYLLIIYNYI